MDRNKVDWIWHYVSNKCECEECGKIESPFPKHVCDAHTHGMDKYNHPEFQVVLDYGPREVGRLLNSMGLRVQNGEAFKDGDSVKGLYKDCDILLREIPDCNGISVLRLVIPDKNYNMPENSKPPYSYQMIATPLLYAGEERKDKE